LPDHSLFLLLVDLAAVRLLVLADLPAPKDENVRAVVAHPALVLVVVGLHSPLAASRYVIFKPNYSLNRHVSRIGLHSDLAEFAVNFLLLYSRQSQGFFKYLRLYFLCFELEESQLFLIVL
jgi:hypothetical protein